MHLGDLGVRVAQLGVDPAAELLDLAGRERVGQVDAGGHQHLRLSPRP
jgi:hypothetical protein